MDAIERKALKKSKIQLKVLYDTISKLVITDSVQTDKLPPNIKTGGIKGAVVNIGGRMNVQGNLNITGSDINLFDEEIKEIILEELQSVIAKLSIALNGAGEAVTHGWLVPVDNACGSLFIPARTMAIDEDSIFFDTMVPTQRPGTITSVVFVPDNE